jgi:acyl-CoA thioester hydrolase
MRMPIRWGDMDLLGHVNNTVYFRYIESARIAWLEEVDGAIFPSGRAEGPVVANAFCSFKKPLKYPGDIEVTTYVGPAGRSSFEVTHEIRLVGPDGNAGAIYAEGGAKVVWIDYTKEKSVRLPEAVRALLPTM